jgi:hypothetical protein
MRSKASAPLAMVTSAANFSRRLRHALIHGIAQDVLKKNGLEGLFGK